MIKSLRLYQENGSALTSGIYDRGRQERHIFYHTFTSKRAATGKKCEDLMIKIGSILPHSPPPAVDSGTGAIGTELYRTQAVDA